MKKTKDFAEQADQEENEFTKQDPSPENVDREVPEEMAIDELTIEEQVDVLQTSLDEMTAKAEEYLDGWQRARAEFANYKKRILKENAEIHQIARGEVIKLYLDILDDLQRALDEKPSQGDGSKWAKGIELIVLKLHNRLETEGVKPMNSLGEDFDPMIHEALMIEESQAYESGQIIEVMQEGYWIGDKVLRPAVVRVAA